MNVENTIHIDADLEVVWAVTEDVDRWSEWTPTMSSVRRLDDRSFGVGSRALVKQPGQAESEWVVTSLTPGERFTWQTHRSGLRMEATHELRVEGNGTSNTLRVVASGVLATLMSPILRPMIRRALDQENSGARNTKPRSTRRRGITRRCRPTGGVRVVGSSEHRRLPSLVHPPCRCPRRLSGPSLYSLPRWKPLGY